MKDFLQFINNRKEQTTIDKMFNESYKTNNMHKFCGDLTGIFKSEFTDKKVLCVGSKFPFKTEITGDEYRSVVYFIDDEKTNLPVISIMLNFKNNDATSIASVSLFNDFSVFLEEKGKAITTMTLDNNSFTYLIPVIVHVCETRNFRLTNEKAVKQIKARLESNKNVDEELFLRHYDFDGINCNIFEAVSPELKEFKRRLYGKAQEYWDKEKGMKPKSSENTDITADYEKVRSEIKAGAETIKDLDLTFKSNLTVKILQEVSEISAQAKIEEERENFEDPHEVWKEMQQYIKLVIKGLNPALILAGAPGVGKTYRVRQQLKAAGYREGNNLWTIKGKCTPRQLYLALYSFKRKGDIIVIDDADGLVGPKAPEDVINILKAALDSTSDDEGRLVSYGVSGNLVDDEGVPVPKRFYYNGGVIVITNYNAGQLDTALRGRSYIQDIHFSIESILQIIEELLPTIDKEKLSMKSKEKAYAYLKEISGELADKIEISIRTFSICARIFESADSDFSDDDCKRMILKQLKLQAVRGGKKY